MQILETISKVPNEGINLIGVGYRGERRGPQRLLRYPTPGILKQVLVLYTILFTKSPMTSEKDIADHEAIAIQYSINIGMKKTVVIFLLISSVNAFAQVSPGFVDSFGFMLYKEKNIFVEAKVNNKTLLFFFDTGATGSLLDKQSASSVGITTDAKTNVVGAGGSNAYDVVKNREIILHQTKIDSIDFILYDLSRLRRSVGKDFDGIVGYDLLTKYLTEINFTTKRFFLYPSDSQLDLGEYKVIDFSDNGSISIPQFDIEIAINNQTYKGRIFFDSGAGLALLVNSPFEQKHQLSSKALKRSTMASNNLSNRTTTVVYMLDTLKFGEYTFANVPVQSSNDKSGVSSMEGYLGILGADIINKFDWVIDYKQFKLYYKPNYLFDKGFKQNVLGFQYKENSNGEVYVDYIDTNSPFYVQGLRENDIIISVNNKSRSDEIKDALFSLKENDTIILRAKRDNKTYSIRQKLYDILK